MADDPYACRALIVVCGITTSHCCETTARVGANLGHDVLFAIDATFCHDRRHPDGTMPRRIRTVSCAELVQVTPRDHDRREPRAEPDQPPHGRSITIEGC